MLATPSCAGKAAAFPPTHQHAPVAPRAPAHAVPLVMPVQGSSHGGATVSKTDGRGFDSFRACSHAPGPPVGSKRPLTIVAAPRFPRRALIAEASPMGPPHRPPIHTMRVTPAGPHVRIVPARPDGRRAWLPVDARSSNWQDSRLLPGVWGFESSSGSPVDPSPHRAGDLGSAGPHTPRPAGSIPAPATTQHTHQRYGRNVPMPVKRGVADAARRLYTERAALRYDGVSRQIRMADRPHVAAAPDRPVSGAGARRRGCGCSA
jgi:hypothetical protein